MERKDFLKKALITGVGSVILPGTVRSESTDPKEEQVGFNHLPNEDTQTADTVYHAANTRGHADHGWLDTYHTFSFANYRNPERNNFGVLRVLNDDKVIAGKGFNRHPHQNMEIVSIPLSGDLEHRDSMGNVAVIKSGDVQVMSAGTGVFHSEFNKNSDKEVRFLQIWMYPNKQGVTPRYDQISISELEKENEFYQILSPVESDQGVWVHQQAWFHLGKFTEEKVMPYSVKQKGNGVYIFVLEGEAEIEGQALSKRDGFGIWNRDAFDIRCKEGSRLLLMDVPMKL